MQNSPLRRRPERVFARGWRRVAFGAHHARVLLGALPCMQIALPRPAELIRA